VSLAGSMASMIASREEKGKTKMLPCAGSGELIEREKRERLSLVRRRSMWGSATSNGAHMEIRECELASMVRFSSGQEDTLLCCYQNGTPLSSSSAPVSFFFP
jgi:hypothetical protein